NWLKALPKTDRVPYKNIEMLIASDGSVRQLKVVGRDESLLAYTFENEKVNPPVAESAFRFTIPPGAQVVDAVEFRSEAQD
ncbi:MAG: outer-membrane lipoprotein carrier protein LolA, partial [Acidobacteriaceae bacterium]|nr:outer-membrane lipoprotein carrier protein LolA [Acidobacteriaceae bacterium]